MIEEKRQYFTILKNRSGFTMAELMVVFAIIGILSTIALKSYMDSRKHVVNAAALSEANGLGKAVINAFLDGLDVDLWHPVGSGPQIGAVDTSGNPRRPIFTLSDGMQAFVAGNSPPGGKGTCTAIIWHPRGAGKTFTLVVDEIADVVSFPDY